MSFHRFNNPASGAYTDLATLAGLRFPATTISLRHPGKALSQLAGPNKSNFRGRGLDFEEVRGYQPGDDIRTIDWRVTARTGDAHTKVFKEERERPVLLFIDQRDSLFFGSQYCFKSVLAAHIAAILGWAALDEGDRVGAMVFNDNTHHEIRPRRSQKNMLQILSQLLELQHALPLNSPPHSNRLATMLTNLRRIAPTGSNIFLVSDFQGVEHDDVSEALFQLARHHQITAICCEDTLEGTLPERGHYTVTDGQQRSELNTGSRHIQQRFAQQQQAQQQQLTQQMQRLGIPLLGALTHQSPLATLQQYYGRGR